MIAVVDGPIDLRAVEDAVRSDAFGAVLVFAGVARNEFGGRAVESLMYEAYGEMAVAELRTIAAEAEARWPGTRVAIAHRTGLVAIGEASVVVAVGAPHRAEAYEASRYAIDALKQRAPIWKKEVYADGSAWIANTP